ncbi:MAG: adenylate/guanylate cyclase domain-containing protein [Flavobacteriaceae bacterium]|nr:adenylate/guanylate cyclase domain-containing protein [Bacteroidia bacterium]NNF75302.1 adenylate/guanylate cyclase domain-containing protein [Flavobacteriaceae bacterium]NNK72412.1 adenylate/guanylate cyclase domain-containing protein [Flavobacteriaceae bacterium]
MRLKSAVFLIWCYVVLCPFAAQAQDQKKADSLTQILKSNIKQGEDLLKLYNDLAYNETDIDLSIAYAEELIRRSTKQNNNIYLYRGYRQLGENYIIKGRVYDAYVSFMECENAAIKADYLKGQGLAAISIANACSQYYDFVNADYYFEKGISLLRSTKDVFNLGIALYNAGNSYLNNNKLDRASFYFDEAEEIFEKEDHEIGIVVINGNRGKILALEGRNEEAREKLYEAIRLLTESGYGYATAEYQAVLAKLYLNENNLTLARKFADESLNFARAEDQKKNIAEASLVLAQIEEKEGNAEAAGNYQQVYDDYQLQLAAWRNDSMDFFQNMRTEKVVMESAIESQQRLIWMSIIGAFLVIVLSVVLYRRFIFVKKTNKIIAEERDRSDNLLLNILPEETAEELKASGHVQAKKFNSVTVLFTDFLGFTHYADNLPPEDLVKAVDFYFSNFDRIIEKYGLEKIKTVGDAYMCAGGLPYPTLDHPKMVVLAALEILEFVEQSKQGNDLDLTKFNVRIGINTGPVVAGVVGTKKFAYDIWGDTVNIASRMETNSDPGKINISDNTYEIIKPDFDCEYRGEIAVKNKGMMKMYYVNSAIETKTKKLLNRLKRRKVTSSKS